jgi:heme/copper-type cytochrome/quinol oxidase subunit 4
MSAVAGGYAIVGRDVISYTRVLPFIGFGLGCSLLGLVLGVVLARRLSKTALIFFVAGVLVVVGVVATLQNFIHFNIGSDSD